MQLSGLRLFVGSEALEVLPPNESCIGWTEAEEVVGGSGDDGWGGGVEKRLAGLDWKSS